MSDRASQLDQGRDMDQAVFAAALSGFIPMQHGILAQVCGTSKP